MDSLYIVNVSQKEYLGLIDDIARMIILQLSIQLMLYGSGMDSQFFSAEFVLLLIYIVLGVCLYWLVFKRFVVFK